MIESFSLDNCGPVDHVEWSPGTGFNVVIGENDTGKTLLLKMLYDAVRSLEEYQRGNDNRTYRQVLYLERS